MNILAKWRSNIIEKLIIQHTVAFAKRDIMPCCRDVGIYCDYCSKNPRLCLLLATCAPWMLLMLCMMWVVSHWFDYLHIHWHCPHSVRNRVYITVGCRYVHPSVPSDCRMPPLQVCRWALLAGDIDRLLHVHGCHSAAAVACSSRMWAVPRCQLM